MIALLHYGTLGHSAIVQIVQKCKGLIIAPSGDEEPSKYIINILTQFPMNLISAFISVFYRLKGHRRYKKVKTRFIKLLRQFSLTLKRMFIFDFPENLISSF